ncbi:MAG: zinc-ribbon domain containing protein [Dehalococcoidia bacterium]
MSFQDKDLTCQDCGATFVFTADDQQYHSDKGYTNEPKRCPNCRSARRDGGGGGGGSYDRGPREMHAAVCAQCGKDTEVPFRPTGDRPVYCSDCFSKRPQQSSRRW